MAPKAVLLAIVLMLFQVNAVKDTNQKKIIRKVVSMTAEGVLGTKEEDEEMNAPGRAMVSSALLHADGSMHTETKSEKEEATKKVHKKTDNARVDTQAKDKNARQSTPFTTDAEQGCNDLIGKCSPHLGDDTAWHNGNLSAWKVGFEMCCVQSGNDDDACDDLDVRLFNIIGPSPKFPGSQAVKDLPQPALDDFCTECGLIIETYFAHEHVNQDAGITTNSVGNLMQSAIQKVHGLKRLMSAGTAQSRSARAKQRLNKCLSDPECSQNIAGVKENLVRASEIIEVKNTQKYASAGCWQPQAGESLGFQIYGSGSGNAAHHGAVTPNLHGVLECRNDCASEDLTHFAFSCPHTNSSGVEVVECLCGNATDLDANDAIELNASNCTHFNAIAPEPDRTKCVGPDFTVDLQNVGVYSFGAGGDITSVYEVNSTDEGFAVVPGWTTTTTTTECFPAMAEVWTWDGGEIRVSELQAGSRLLSPELKPSMTPTLTEYMTDVHLQDPNHADIMLEYLEITHELMKPGRPLHISGNHLLYASVESTGPWALTLAGDVKVGDFVLAAPLSKQEDLVTTDARPVLKASAVTKLTKVRLPGMYSPLTMTGRLVVDGVAVSSLGFTTAGQLKAFRFGQSRGATPEQIEFFIGLALFPNKIWYWAGLPFSWLHGGYSSSRGPTKFWEWFFDTLVLPPVVYMEQQTGCVKFLLNYIL